MVVYTLSLGDSPPCDTPLLQPRDLAPFRALLVERRQVMLKGDPQHVHRAPDVAECRRALRLWQRGVVRHDVEDLLSHDCRSQRRWFLDELRRAEG